MSEAERERSTERKWRKVKGCGVGEGEAKGECGGVEKGEGRTRHDKSAGSAQEEVKG